MSAPATPGQGLGCPLVAGAVLLGLGVAYLLVHLVVWAVR